MSGNDQQIQALLARWAVEEMGFLKRDNKEGSRSKEWQETAEVATDLSGICLGPLADIWSYIIQHVKSEPNVQIIKGNIKLSSEKAQDVKQVALWKERDKLRQDVADLLKSTKILQESLTETRTTMQDKEVEFENHKLALRNLERSSFVLRWLSHQTQDEIRKLNQTAKNLESSLQALSPDPAKEVDIGSFKIDVELMCQQLQHSLIELTREIPDMNKIQDVKKGVRSSLAGLMKTLPRPVLLQLIQEQQDTDMSLLANLVSGPPSIKKNGNNDLFASATENVQPLQKLLYELAWFYVDSQTRATKAKKQAARLKEELNRLKSEVNQHLNIHFNEASADNMLKELAFQLVQLELQVASRMAAEKTLRKSLVELENFCLHFEASQSDIRQKIAAIERNSRMADHLSSLICTLARKHAENPRTIQQSTSRLQSISNEQLSAVHSQLASCADLCKESLVKEVELFRQVKPCQLLNTSLDKKLLPVNRLAMCRFLMSSVADDPGANLLASHLQAALKHLGLHGGTSVVRVFQAVGEKWSKIRSMKHALKWHEMRQSEISEQYGRAWLEHGGTHFTKLTKTLALNREGQRAEILPSLEHHLKKMEEASQLTTEVQIALTEWCDEPAKLILTGRTVNGQSLEHWRQQWSKSITQCRKKE